MVSVLDNGVLALASDVYGVSSGAPELVYGVRVSWVTNCESGSLGKEVAVKHDIWRNLEGIRS